MEWKVVTVLPKPTDTRVVCVDQRLYETSSPVVKPLLSVVTPFGDEDTHSVVSVPKAILRIRDVQPRRVVPMCIFKELYSDRLASAPYCESIFS